MSQRGELLPTDVVSYDGVNWLSVTAVPGLAVMRAVPAAAPIAQSVAPHATCRGCNRQLVIAYAPGPNHILHLVLSLLTAGFWLIIWFFAALGADRKPKCAYCGRDVQTTDPGSPAAAVWVLIIVAILMVVGIRQCVQSAGTSKTVVAPKPAAPKSVIVAAPSNVSESPKQGLNPAQRHVDPEWERTAAAMRQLQEEISRPIEAEPSPMASVPIPTAPPPTLPAPSERELRTWTLADGRRMEARLKTWSITRVVLVQENGSEFVGTAADFSPADAEYVRQKVRR